MKTPPYYFPDTEFPVHRAIDDLRLSYWMGAALKYIVRAGRKTADLAEDLAKAVDCLQHECALRSDVNALRWPPNSLAYTADYLERAMAAWQLDADTPRAGAVKAILQGSPAVAHVLALGALHSEAPQYVWTSGVSQ